MALADYFDRASESAAQVLNAYDQAEFERRLHARDPVIAYDANATSSREGRATLDLLVRLLARLYPKLELRPLGKTTPLPELAELATAINPEIELAPARSGDAVVLAVGSTDCSGGTVFHLGSDRWVARASTRKAVGCGDSSNPFGAGAAACIGAANLFRVYFGDLLERGKPDREITFSLLDFGTGADAANGDLPADGSLGSVQLVGVGAIGNAAIWALARLEGLHGVLDLIDPQDIELSNIQRYVLATRADELAVKVDLAAGHFGKGGAIIARKWKMRWADYVVRGGTYRFDLVATALDTPGDRVEVQGTLPRQLVNAWTQPGDVGVSRHSFLGKDACLACLYRPTGTRRNEDEIIADELRMPEKVRDLRTLLHNGEPVGIEFVREVAARAAIDAAMLEPFAELPLRAFRARAICGDAILPAPDADTTLLQVPLAFQSALAGIMLGAEVTATVLGLREKDLPTKSVVDLLRPFPKGLNVPVLKASEGAARCICADEDYIAAYCAKYDPAHDD